MKNGVWLVVVFVVALGAMVAWKLLRPPAPTPAVFGAGTTLAGAIERSKAEDKPVFAVATADWCAPCQAYKRGALADERVAAYLEASTIPVYINIDDDPADAERLGVSAVPTTVLLRDGEVVDRFSGRIDAPDLLEWLERAAPPTQG